MKNKNKNEINDIYGFQRRIMLYFGMVFTILITVLSIFILNSVATVYRNEVSSEIIATTERIQEYIRDGNSPDEAAVAGFLNDRNIDFRIMNYGTGEISKSNFDDNSPFSDIGYLEVGQEKRVKSDPAVVTVEAFKYGNKYVIARKIMYYDGEKYTIEASKTAELNAVYYRGLLMKTAIIDIAGIIMVIYLSKYLCRLIFVPIENISRLAESISIDDLSQRIPEDENENEIGLKKLVSAFNSMIARLETSFKKQTQFVSDASHELKTPIAVINGYINLIDRWGKERPEILQEAIDSIKAQTESMNVLIKKLLFMAKYDQMTTFSNPMAVSPQEAAEEVMKEFKMIHPEKNVLFKGDSDKKILADMDAVKQLLWIYADNAFKYTKPENTITFAVRNDDKYVYLSVEDDGPGISKENLPYVFDRFFRADKSRNREIGGSGLGLSIAQKMISVFDGEVYVESEPNVRTAFINKFKIYEG